MKKFYCITLALLMVVMAAAFSGCSQKSELEIPPVPGIAEEEAEVQEVNEEEIDPASWMLLDQGYSKKYEVNDNYYGFWTITAATGAYRAYLNQSWDVCAKVFNNEEDPDGDGKMLIIAEGYTFEQPLCSALIKDYISEAGTFWETNLTTNPWSVEKDACGYKGLYAFNGRCETEKGTYTYVMYLRVWGDDWAEEVADGGAKMVQEQKLPAHLEGWYASYREGEMPREIVVVQ